VKKQPAPSEFELIARLFSPLAADLPGAFGLLDDAAVIDVPKDRKLVVTVDAMASGVHFLAEDPPALVAKKLLRVNLSDLAAMGAVPLAYLLTVAFGADEDSAWFEEFARGLAEDQALFGTVLAGGDSIRTPGPLTLSLAAYGTVAPGSELRRAGACADDVIYVSGTLGDAALGLLVLQGKLDGLGQDSREALVDRYRMPQPRLALGQALCGTAHAAIDISDGLVADLQHVCNASGVAAEIKVGALPLSVAAREALAGDPELIERVLAGGDDYELLFTAPAAAGDVIADLAGRCGVAVTPIGRVVSAAAGDDPVRVRAENGSRIRLESPGFRHF